MRIMHAGTTIAALATALALAGCSFGPDVPDTLMTLAAAQPIAVATSRTAAAGEAITVAVPEVPQQLRTNRVPVQSGATAVAYLKDAQWVDMPAALFGRLLSETIGARTGRVVLSPGQFALDPGVRLSGQLQAFGIDAATSEAVVVYDAVLARTTQRVETRRFEARVPVAAIDATNAPAALNQAANQVAADVAGWVGG